MLTNYKDKVQYYKELVMEMEDTWGTCIEDQWGMKHSADRNVFQHLFHMLWNPWQYGASDNCYATGWDELTYDGEESFWRETELAFRIGVTLMILGTCTEILIQMACKF